MSDIIEGPPTSHANVLWSIANSVEPAFPNAADTLRAVALDLRSQVENDAGVRRHCPRCETSWSPARIAMCPGCDYFATTPDPLVALASVPGALDELS